VIFTALGIMFRRSTRKKTPSLLPSEVAPSLASRAKPVTRCEETWNVGVPTKSIEEFPVWMKPSKNCALPVDGKYAYVSPPAKLNDLETYIREVERVNDAEGFRGKAGVYTWILYRIAGDATIRFAAAHVKSVIELGTLHHALARGTGAVTVHGAGELKKRDAATHAILVNFQSGSFMEKWVLPESCSLPEMERFVLGKLRMVLRGLRVETPRKSTFITDELTPPTMDELRSYAARGFKVCLYDDKDSCWKGKGTCANPLDSEKKEGGDKTMPKKGAGTATIIGLALDERGKPTKEVSPSDPTAVQWFNTKTYRSLTKEQALAGQTPGLGQENRPMSPGSPLKPSRVSAAVGLGRRKTRRGKKSRKITRRR